MKWYESYLSCYEIDPKLVKDETFENIKLLLNKRNSLDPILSIVIIAHNEEKRILACLWSLCNNICDYPLEIIVVNNNSSDQTEELLKRLNVTYYNETQKGPGYARQCGLNHAKGKYYLCIDADTLYPPYYIATHIANLEAKNVIATYSLWSFFPDKTHSSSALKCYEILRDIYLYFQSFKRPELNVRGMAFSFKIDRKSVG